MRQHNLYGVVFIPVSVGYCFKKDSDYLHNINKFRREEKPYHRSEQHVIQNISMLLYELRTDGDNF